MLLLYPKLFSSPKIQTRVCRMESHYATNYAIILKILGKTIHGYDFIFYVLYWLAYQKLQQ